MLSKACAAATRVDVCFIRPRRQRRAAPRRDRAARFARASRRRQNRFCKARASRLLFNRIGNAERPHITRIFNPNNTSNPRTNEAQLSNI